MSESENPVSPSAFSVKPTSASLNEQVESLRKLFIAAVVALLILSFGLNIFFLRQMLFVRKDLEVVRPQVNQLLANYQAAEDPQIKMFINTLVNYGRSHPDFMPILAKYKVVPETTSPPRTAAPAVSNPTPTPAKPVKK